MTISKSEYMMYLKHPAWLWLKKYEKYKLPAIDDNTQALFDMGHEFEAVAEQLFPNEVKLGFDGYDEYLSLPERTLEELNNGTETIFQGRFEVDGITCIVDVLQKVGNDTYDLIEIKASTKAKPEHEYDLAFQLLTLQKAGLNIRNIEVAHVNRDYIRQGTIDPEGITGRTYVTEAVIGLLDLTEEQLNEARELLQQEKMPDISPRHVNKLGIPRVRWFEDWMEVFEKLNGELDPYCIYKLSYPSPEQIGQLEDQGITTIAEIPEELALREKQIGQIKTTRDDKQIIDKQKIKNFLANFEFPLYFLDYETFSSVIPAFDGCKPYKDYPFQYSLHVLDSPDAKAEHLEYIHADDTNPMPELIKHLTEAIGDTGTILTWNMRYEKACNKRMAKIYPQYEDFLKSVNERVDDLMIPFSEMWCVDKDFFGSASIKNVLPALVPELKHSDLDVSDGLHARRLWTETFLQGEHPGSEEQILEELSKYCTLDTYAMVRIYHALRDLVSE